MRKRVLASVLAAGMLAALFTACGGNKKAADDPAGKTDRAAADEIVVGIAQDLDESLDPHYAVAAGTKEVMFNVFEGLVKPTPEGDLVPAVASDVSVAPDGSAYTFTLREGVKFHNGDPVEMQDVLFSIERNRTADDGGEPLIPALANISEISGEGDTLTVTLAEPDNDFLSYMTLAVLPADYDAQATAPVGTGPFRFVSRIPQQEIVLERFADYWGDAPALAKATFKIIENAQGLILGLQSGALDLVSHLGSTQAAQLSEADFRIEEGTMNLVQALYLNHKEKPFDDLRVRQALCYAADKENLLALAYDGYGSPIGSSMYPAFTKYFDASLTDYYPHDIEKAKALLAEAGYPNGFDMTITVPANYQPHVDAAQVLREQFAEIGVNATVEPVEWGTWLSDVYAGRQFQSTVIGVDASNMTARALLERFVSDNDGNFINYNNAQYDALFKEAVSTFDDAAQTALYKEMEKNLTENAANVYLQDMADLVAVRNGLADLTFYPLYVLDVSSLYWETEK